MNREEIRKEFVKNIAEHEINIIKDDGTYRHVRYKRPNSHTYYFDLVTWKGHLVITGDMHTYHFSRIDDMFDFFIMDKNDFNHKYIINPCYWAEKLEGDIKYKEYTPEKFERVIKGIYDDYINDEGCDIPDKEDLWSSIKISVLGAENGFEAHNRANDFEYGNFEFTDFWEYDIEEYIYHYIWCCYAIVWGIQLYNKTKEGATCESHTHLTK